MKILLQIFAIASLLVLVTNLGGAVDKRILSDLQNFGHAPLFGMAALALVRSFRKREAQPARNRAGFLPYLLTIIVVLGLGLLTEWIQAMSGRDAEAADVVTDAAGATAFLIAHWSFTPGIPRIGRFSARLAAGVILLGFALPSLITGASMLRRNRMFPVINNFDSLLDTRFCSARDAQLSVVPDPAGSHAPSGNRMARITFAPADFSTFVMEEPYPDWQGYSELEFLAYSDLQMPVTLVVRIEDERHNNNYNDRFNAAFIINPGINAIHIPLTQIENAPEARRLDMTAIAAFMIFAVSPPKSFSVYFDDFQLR